MAESTKLWWYWRNRNDKVLARSLVQFLLATSCTVSFIAASIASSFVVSSSDLEILVRSPFCGGVNGSVPSEILINFNAAVGAVSIPYVEECYRNQTVLPARCKAYVNPRVGFTTERVACPFDGRFCAADTLGNLPAIAFDSGLVDPNAAFGLNLPKKDQVKYRRRTTCAVLSLEGRTSIVDARDFPDVLQQGPDIPGERFLLAHYGDRPNLGEWRNTTATLSLVRNNYSSAYTTRWALQVCYCHLSFRVNLLVTLNTPLPLIEKAYLVIVLCLSRVFVETMPI
jgi:hypothetical protein